MRQNERIDRARRGLLFLAALAPGWTSAVAAREDTRMPSDLARAAKAYDDATVNNDTAALAELVAEDYQLVNSDSSLQDKQSYLADFEVPGFRLDPYVIEQPLLRFWGDAALTGGVLNLSWTLDGRHEQRRLRIAHVWTRRAGHWRLSYTQLTRVPRDELTGPVALAGARSRQTSRHEHRGHIHPDAKDGM